MRGRGCEHEADVMRALVAGERPEWLERHTVACESCRQAEWVAGWLQDLSSATNAVAAERPLPEAGFLWWKAQLVRRWQAEQRATAPIETMYGGGQLAAALLALLVFAWWQGPSLVAWLLPAESSGARALVTPITTSALGPLVLAGAALLAIAATVVVGTFLISER